MTVFPNKFRGVLLRGTFLFCLAFFASAFAQTDSSHPFLKKYAFPTSGPQRSFSAIWHNIALASSKASIRFEYDYSTTAIPPVARAEAHFWLRSVSSPRLLYHALLISQSMPKILQWDLAARHFRLEPARWFELPTVSPGILEVGFALLADSSREKPAVSCDSVWTLRALAISGLPQEEARRDWKVAGQAVRPESSEKLVLRLAH